ncbi:MAG: hypothetical protein WCO54_02340 [Bacteroidota bacterium]
MKPHYFKSICCKLLFRNKIQLKFLSILLLLFLTLKVSAQTTNPCGDLISNGEFNCSNYPLLVNYYNYENPFGSGGYPNLVQPWYYGWASPQLNLTSYYSSPSAAMMWSLAPSSPSSAPIYEAIVQNIYNLEAGKPYIFVAWAECGASAWVDFMNIYLCDNFSVFTPQPQQSVLHTPVYNTSFAKYSVCNLTPTQNWTKLVIHPMCYNPMITAWLTIDDVKLIENFDFAGGDTSLCKGSCINIGKSNCYGSDASYRWYEFPNTTPFDTNATVTVCPDSSKTYVLKRTLFGCTAYDTINVTVIDQPTVELGNDTVICIGYYLLTAGTDSNFKYLWNTGDTTLTLSVTVSGEYSVTVCNSSCCATDSIHVTIVPEFHITPDTIRLCNNDSATFCATPGFAHYSWSPTGDTTNCITVYNAGWYFVTVTDTNGCTASGFAMLYRGQPKPFTLGPDIDTCLNGCLVLKPKGPDQFTDTLLYHFHWSTGDTTKSITVCASGTFILSISDTSGCVSRDTISIRIYPIPIPSVSNIGPYCLHDSAHTISGTPSGGVFTGVGVSGTTFTPEIAGVGVDSIIYTVTNSYGCTARDTFTATVVDGPYAELKPEFACYPSGDIYLTLLQGIPGGTWSSNAPGGIFPQSLPGIYEVTYTLTDSITGCTFTAKANISIGNRVTAQYTELSDPYYNWLCENRLVDFQSTTINGNVFKWINRDDYSLWGDKVIGSLKANGNYRLIVSDSMGNCPDSINIDISYPSCCEQPASYPEFFEVSENGDSLIYPYGGDISIMGKYVIDKILVVPPGRSLYINSSDIIMKGCAKIFVYNEATLTIDNSQLGYCNWQGVEAAGWRDCVQPGGPGSCYGMGNSNVFVINGSKIHEADVAIFAGTRLYNGIVSNDQSGGAFLYVHDSYFSNNYIDILFREYDATCAFALITNQWNYSTVTNNWFNKPKSALSCDNKNVLSDLISRYGGNPPLCHIMDFAQNSFFYIGLCGTTGQLLRGNIGWWGVQTNMITIPNPSPNPPGPSSIPLPANIYDNHYYNGCAAIQRYK